MKLVILKQTEPSTWEGLPPGDRVLIQYEDFKKFVNDVLDTMVDMLPGVKKIALQDYRRLNDVMVELERLKRKLG